MAGTTVDERTDLRLRILAVLMDDAEDVERVYLSLNWNELKEGSMQPKFPLHEIIDEMKSMLREGHITARYTNDEVLAPIASLDSQSIHQYWFSPTDKGRRLWTDSNRGVGSAEN